MDLKKKNLLLGITLLLGACGQSIGDLETQLLESIGEYHLQTPVCIEVWHRSGEVHFTEVKAVSFPAEILGLNCGGNGELQLLRELEYLVTSGLVEQEVEKETVTCEYRSSRTASGKESFEKLEVRNTFSLVGHAAESYNPQEPKVCFPHIRPIAIAEIEPGFSDEKAIKQSVVYEYTMDGDYSWFDTRRRLYSQEYAWLDPETRFASAEFIKAGKDWRLLENTVSVR